MSIKTTKTNAHQQRPMPKPLRAGGLHSIETTGAVYAHAYVSSTPQPLDRARAFDSRMRAVQGARVCNSTAKGSYTGAEFAPSNRPGAMDFLRHPSLRAGGKRVWPKQPGGEPC